MTSDPDRIRRIRELFDLVMEQDTGLRSQFLNVVAMYDPPDFRREVEALLATERDTESIPGFQRDAEPSDTIPGLIGQRLGAYSVVRHIGNGGMGAVYEAVRADDEYRKRVAIKLVHRGLDSQITMARFRRERQILANLEHRNIATLLDGGVAADGRPFLAMEYVDGVPITKWCDERRASIETRLELFKQVCAAVQHAHLNLVVHLDIKPGNILVTADGTVKLLDFGIARLIEGEADESMPVTRGGPRAFTPEYASPEHVRGERLTTAADVYSLGVVLFELLSGRRPFTQRNVANTDRPTTDDTVPRPSAVATADAAMRCGERNPDRLRMRLRGDLDSITTMALRHEPERRYQSAEALRTDISRFLSRLPVRARPDSAAYRARRFIRRNVVGVTLASAVVIALVGGITATTLQASRARAEQIKAEELNVFLRSLLSSVRPATGGRDVLVSEVLDSAAIRIQRDTRLDPRARAQLETVIAQSYQSLGRFDEALRHFAIAESTISKTWGARSLQRVAAIANSGGALLAQGRLDSAEAALNQALALRKSITSAPDTLLASITGNLGSVAHERGQPKESERLHREALTVLRRVLGPGDDKVAISMNNLAVALGEQNRWADAEALHRQAIAIFVQNHPGLHTLTADAENSLATALDIQGKVAAAESTYLSVLHMRRRLLGSKHPDYAFTLFNYSMFLSDQGRCDESVRNSREVLALRGGALPESHSSIAASLQTLGRCLDKLGRHEEARVALQESLDLRRKYLGEESWLVANARGVLGEHFVMVKQYDLAESLLLAAERVLLRTLGPDNPRTRANARRLAALYDSLGEKTAAQSYRVKAGPPFSR